MNNLSPSKKLIIKVVLEFLPLGLFFLATTQYDFWWSTVVLMVATVFSLVAVWYLFRQLALMAIITAVTSIVAGSGTLIANDEMWVQLKPTIVGGVFALILAAGLVWDKPLFKVLLGQTLYLSEKGWRVLTWLWFIYFVFITGLNEFIWRSFSFEFWAAFKAFGLMPLTVIYAVPQVYLLKRYQIPQPASMASSQKLNTTKSPKVKSAEAPAE